MATFELILLLAAAVLLSAVLEQVIPKVSLPLIQVALGVVVALLAAAPININFNPEFFLLLFIAPLLFYDAKNIDKLGLWRNRYSVLLLAVGLVIVIMVVVGFVLHAFVPVIPLAAALALGAALGPTDAVAVLALSKVANVSRREKALLEGEALLNDASGIVAFQFAIAAAVTGSFAVWDASVNFAVSFFGGIIVGLVLGLVAHWITEWVNDLGLDSNTFHVLFDVMLPFIIYLLSSILGVSGILAVVAAGLLISGLNERTIGPAAARLSIVESNVWNVLSFALNGIVFVILGMQLPKGMRSSWESTGIGNEVLIALIIGLTVLLVLVRFAFVMFADRFSRDPETGERDTPTAERLRSALVTTVGGAKGAVTLCIIMSTPFFVESGNVFPERNLIIFLASGVIVLTLLLANFLLPALAPCEKVETEDPETVARAMVDVFRNVISRLSESRTKENARAVAAVIGSYNDRIARTQDRADIEGESTDQLRIEVLHRQQEKIFDLIEKGEIDEVEGYNYLRGLSKAVNYLKHTNEDRFVFFQSLRHTSTTWRVLRRSVQRAVGALFGSSGVSEANHIRVLADQVAIEYLRDLMDSPDCAYPTEVVAKVLLQYQTAHRTMSESPGFTAYAKANDQKDDIERMAYNFELEEIRLASERGSISRATAKRMRDNVYLMLVDLDGRI